MLRFDNSHIFTGYLKQKLSSVNIPICKIYTSENEKYFIEHGVEDPRIVESLDTIVYTDADKQLATRINYLRGNEVFNYYNDNSRKLNKNNKTGWSRANLLFYDSSKNTPGLTKTLKSQGTRYDKATHEYLGDYLRFLRDYHGINLMSMYNCFSNTLCNNVNIKIPHNNKEAEFSSYDSKYRIYAFPVKLFSKYTIAIDSHHGIEVFCGLYNSRLYNPSSADKIRKDKQLGSMTYLKTGKLSFNQPIIFDKLCVENWGYEREVSEVSDRETILNTKVITRWDILNREQDLKMFIKVPVSCRSSIVVLEGDYRNYNNARYILNPETNIAMTGCSLGDSANTYLPETTSSTVKGYQISNWQFGYRDTTTANKVGDEQFGWIIPSINYTEVPSDAEIWDGVSYKKPEYSEEFDGCLIKTGAELAFVIANKGKVLVDTGETEKLVSYFRLANDIYLNDTSKIDWKTGNVLDDEYVPRQWFYATEEERNQIDATTGKVPSFSGAIDGNGHIIFGLYIKHNNTSITHGGLIPLIDGDSRTTLKNLGLSCIYVNCIHSLGFVGSATPSVVTNDTWRYEQNHSIVNMGFSDRQILNDVTGFRPISKLQLLEFNTGESFPFADRLLEYLCGSAITPMDEIPDNIKRAQQVMEHNGHRFKIKGLWEDKMQKIVYDYVMGSGPIETVGDKKVDRRLGYHPSLGHRNKSTVYDILGYVDKDAEKWYAGTTKKNKVAVRETIQHADIYNGLYDL